MNFSLWKLFFCIGIHTHTTGMKSSQKEVNETSLLMLSTDFYESIR